MNTPAIAAVLPSAAAPPSGAGAGRNEPDSGNASFSSVLARQHGAGPAASAAQSPGQKTEGKQGKAEEHGAEQTTDDALADNTSVSVIALPQITLHIAAEVAAVQHASGIGRHLHGQQASVSLHHDGAAAGTAINKPPAAGTAALTDALWRAADAASTKAATTTGASQPGSAPAQPAALIPEPAISDGKQIATAASLTASRAASIAGAKQAVLTMQARVQAGEASPDTIIPPDFLAAKAQVARALESAPVAPSLELSNIAGSNGHGYATGLASGAASGASVLGAAPAAATPGNMLAVATPLGNPNWGADFSRQFVSITQGANNLPHTAELRLDPPELGPLRISINISDNVANAVFVSPHAAVRQTVENALPQLQQLLAQAGISLGQTSVNDQGQPDQAFQQPSPSGSHGTGGTGIAAVGAHDAGLATAMARSPASDALVDTFA